jgi:hypothetical protein
MTYKEAYMNCKTLEELEKEVEKDIKIAILINPDRIAVIKKVCEEVANLKFKED